MTLRRAEKGDIPTLGHFSRAVFIECFGHLYSPENLNTFLNDKHSDAYYTGLLHSGDSEVWLLEEEGTLQGYIQYGAVTLPVDVTEDDCEIHRIYITQHTRSKGTGRMLMHHAMQALAQAGKKTIYLGVWSQNTRALGFYNSLGFEKCGEYLFYVGDHADEEWILRKAI